MPLEPPKLDTRTQKQLVLEAQRRIARYNKEWTDFNDSDPGMTLVQLFAWLTETMLYEMNRLPELNYIKFLKLLDMAPAPPAPATVDLTFTTVPNGHGVDPVPAGTQVGGESVRDRTLIVFETEEDLELIRPPLASVEVMSSWGFQVETPANEATNRPFYTFGRQPQVDDALYLGFAVPEAAQDTGGNPFPGNMRFHVFRASDAPGAGAMCCSAVDDLPPSPVTLTWEARVKADPPQWRELPLVRDETSGFTRSGAIQLIGPRSVEPSRDGRAGDLRYWLRCRLTKGTYAAGRAPFIDMIRPNTVRAVSLSTVRQERLGKSNGGRNQVFTLQGAPVDAGSIELVTRSGAHEELWERRLDLLGSGQDDPHYVVDATTAEITFGDGDHGRVPPAGAEIVAKCYRFGGGDDCNLAPGTINQLLSASITGVAAVINLRAAVGGHDEQRVEDLKRKAPRALRNRNRAVTADDYAHLAQKMAGVARAVALPLHHPRFPGVDVPGAVTVVVVPDFDLSKAAEELSSGKGPPGMNDEQLAHICRELNRLRILTTEVYVKNARYRRIRVSADVETRRSVSFELLRRKIVAELNAYLDPFAREFGEDVHPARLLTQIQRVDGVVNVRQVGVRVDGEEHPFSVKVEVPPDAVVWGEPDHKLIIDVGRA